MGLDESSLPGYLLNGVCYPRYVPSPSLLASFNVEIALTGLIQR